MKLRTALRMSLLRSVSERLARASSCETNSGGKYVRTALAVLLVIDPRLDCFGFGVMLFRAEKRCIC